MARRLPENGGRYCRLESGAERELSHESADKQARFGHDNDLTISHSGSNAFTFTESDTSELFRMSFVGFFIFLMIVGPPLASHVVS